MELSNNEDVTLSAPPVRFVKAKTFLLPPLLHHCHHLHCYHHASPWLHNRRSGKKQPQIQTPSPSSLPSPGPNIFLLREKASWLLQLLREQRIDGMRAQAKISRYPGQSLIILSRSKLLFNEGLFYAKPCAKHAIYMIYPFSAQQPELFFF